MLAVAGFHEVFKLVTPLRGEIAFKQKQIARLKPGLEVAAKKHAEYKALLSGHKRALKAKFPEVIAVVLTMERVEAQQLVGSLLGMEGALTNQQYFRLLRDVDLFLGELSIIFRHLSVGMPPIEISPSVQALLKGAARKPFYQASDTVPERDRREETVLSKFPFLYGEEDPSAQEEAEAAPLAQQLGSLSGLTALRAFEERGVDTLLSAACEATVLPPLVSPGPAIVEISAFDGFSPLGDSTLGSSPEAHSLLDAPSPEPGSEAAPGIAPTRPPTEGRDDSESPVGKKMR